MQIAIIILAAYLIGSIPVSLWLGMLFYKTDVRNAGSGSSGATNVLRVLGPKIAFPVLILDLSKGFASTLLVFMFFDKSDSDFVMLQLGAGIAAMIGHIFPVFAQFKGGKGVATMTGVLFGAVPQVMIIAFPLFIIIVAITRFVSAGSILASFSIPWLLFFFTDQNSGSYIVFAFIVFLIVVFTHRTNIKRLINGTENKISFRKKKSGS